MPDSTRILLCFLSHQIICEVALKQIKSKQADQISFLRIKCKLWLPEGKNEGKE